MQEPLIISPATQLSRSYLLKSRIGFIWILANCVQKMACDAAEVKDPWMELSADVLESVFSKLSEPYVRMAACVCKRWHDIGTDFLLRLPNTAFFRVYGVRYSLTEKDGSYVIEQADDSEDVRSPEPYAGICFEGAGDIYYSYTRHATVFYKLHILEKNFRETSAVIDEDNFAPFPLYDTVVGVVRKISESGSRHHKIVFSGGYPYSFEDQDECSVVIYDSRKDVWDRCAYLPDEFQSRTDSDEMNAVIHRGMFYAYHRKTGLLAYLDTDSKEWSSVKWVLPPEKADELVLVSQSDQLYLLGIQNGEGRDLCFRVWSINEDTLEVGALLCTTEIRNSPEPRKSSAVDVRREHYD